LISTTLGMPLRTVLRTVLNLRAIPDALFPWSVHTGIAPLLVLLHHVFSHHLPFGGTSQRMITTSNYA
jgi:hypothetical protein